MKEKNRYLPDGTTQQVDVPEPHGPATTPEVVFGMDMEILNQDMFPLEQEDEDFSTRIVEMP